MSPITITALAVVCVLFMSFTETHQHDVYDEELRSHYDDNGNLVPDEMKSKKLSNKVKKEHAEVHKLSKKLQVVKKEIAKLSKSVTRLTKEDPFLMIPPQSKGYLAIGPE